MFKKFTYLVNSFFLFFDDNISTPEEAGKKTAHAIKEALYSVYPDGKLKGNGVHGIRTNWFMIFIKNFMEEINIIIEEKFNNEKI